MSDRIEYVKDLKHCDKDGNETDKPAKLEDQFDYLLDILGEKEQEIDKLVKDLTKFQNTWQNHRHSVGEGLYSGKAER